MVGAVAHHETETRGSRHGHTEVMSLANVMIVEDERFTRTILTVTLQALGCHVVGSCTTAKEALALAEQRGVDVALLDVDLGPGPSGVDIAHALRATSPMLGIIMLTTFTDPRLRDPSERPLPQGARYIVKTTLDDPEILRSTIVDTVRYPLKSVATKPKASALTSLQLEVLRLVARGDTNAEIAQIHGVSEKAVERTIQRICETLGLRDHTGNRRVLMARAYSDLSGKALPS